MNNSSSYVTLPEWESLITSMVQGVSVFAFEQVDSTMNVARELHAHPPYLVVARHQSSGRGREGKAWQSPADALKMTLVMPQYDRLRLAQGYSLHVGLEIAQLLNHDFGTDIKVKWPNDLYTQDGKKLGGILIESVGPDKVLVGIGLNLGSVPMVADSQSLGAIASCRIPDAPTMAARISNRLLGAYQQFLTQGLYIEEWQSLGYGIGRSVQIYDGDSIRLQGIFRGISPVGEALIETAPEVTSKILSGTLRFV